MENRHFGSKGTAGLCQPLIALMPPGERLAVLSGIMGVEAGSS